MKYQITFTQESLLPVKLSLLVKDKGCVCSTEEALAIWSLLAASRSTLSPPLQIPLVSCFALLTSETIVFKTVFPLLWHSSKMKAFPVKLALSI